MFNERSISVSTENDLRIVVFDDGKANALSHASIDALLDAITSSSTSRALVLCGRPDFWSAGLDTAVVRGGGPAAVCALVDHLGELLDAVRTLPIPVVAACTGHALAGGALLLMACDYRIGRSNPNSKIGLTEVEVGIALPEFGLALSRNRLERRFLTRATSLAEVVDPDTAVAWGFLDRTTNGDVLVEAKSVAASLTDRLEPLAFAATKGDLNADLEPTISAVARGQPDNARVIESPPRATSRRAVNLADKLDTFDELWSPRTVAQFNGHDVMVVKVKGEFVRHRHDTTDDLFLVLNGHLTIRLDDGNVELGQGEMFVVPVGTEHQPYSAEGAELLLIEPTETPNTGDARTATPRALI